MAAKAPPQPLAVLSSMLLEVEASGSDALSQRRNRRAHVSPDLLRSKKLAAGEWVLLRATEAGNAADGSGPSIGWVVAQLWPRVGLDEDGGCCRVACRSAHAAKTQ